MGSEADLSIVIPVWNEESKIREDIRLVDQHFSGTDLSIELIISDDGSTDSTVAIAKEHEKTFFSQLKIIDNKVHRGKGYAVKSGVLASTGKIVMFMDSGGNVPLHYIDSGMKLLRSKQYLMVFGSRHHKESKIVKNLVWYRQITSYFFRKLVKFYLKIPAFLTDTQCGFKLFDGPTARNMFSMCKTDGFLFDLEILLLALQNQHQLTELPIEWRCDRDSRLSVSGSFKEIFEELRILRHRLLL